MIVELIFTPIFAILGWLVNLMPVMELPEFVMGAISGMISIFNTANFFLPMSSLFVILGAIMLFEVGMVGFYVVNWIVHRVPFIG